MDKGNSEKELKRILDDNNNIGTMATIHDNKPMRRYMYFTMTDLHSIPIQEKGHIK